MTKVSLSIDTATKGTMSIPDKTYKLFVVVLGSPSSIPGPGIQESQIPKTWSSTIRIILYNFAIIFYIKNLFKEVEHVFSNNLIN